MLGICYVIRKEGVIKSDQVRFKKGKKQKQPLSQARVLICPERSLRMGMLFEVGRIHV